MDHAVCTKPVDAVRVRDESTRAIESQFMEPVAISITHTQSRSRNPNPVAGSRSLAEHGRFVRLKFSEPAGTNV